MTEFKCVRCGEAWSKGHDCANADSPIGRALVAHAGAEMRPVQSRGLIEVVNGRRHKRLWGRELAHLTVGDLARVRDDCADLMLLVELEEHSRGVAP